MWWTLVLSTRSWCVCRQVVGLAHPLHEHQSNPAGTTSSAHSDAGERRLAGDEWQPEGLSRRDDAQLSSVNLHHAGVAS